MQGHRTNAAIHLRMQGGKHPAVARACRVTDVASGWLRRSRELRTGVAGMTAAVQNERETEKANACLSEGLKGLADCAPSFNEPRSKDS